MSTRLAWVGTAHIHTPGFSREVAKRGLSCAGVWDHDQARAEKNAEVLGGKSCPLDELKGDATVDGYVICSETIHHLDLVEQIAPTGKPVFLEKPMGANAEQSGRICKLLEDNHVTFQTGYFSRGIGAVRTLKKKVDEGHFGTITRVRASNCHSGALGGWFDSEWRWMADRKQAGVGAFGDLGTHSLDLLLWLFGNITSVTGILSPGTARYDGCDELGEALLMFSTGAMGTLAASWDDVADPVKLQVAGTKGHATWGGAGLLIAGEDGKLQTPELLPDAPGGFDAFLDHLAGEKVELVTPKEAVRRDVTMDAIYRGAEARVWVDIDSESL